MSYRDGSAMTRPIPTRSTPQLSASSSASPSERIATRPTLKREYPAGVSNSTSMVCYFVVDATRRCFSNADPMAGERPYPHGRNGLLRLVLDGGVSGGRLSLFCN